MKVLFVVERAQHWPFDIPGSAVVTARAYLTEAAYASGVEACVVNLCRTDRYQGRGYYVSLLAEARGHRPLPDVKSVEDLQAPAQVQQMAHQFDELARGTITHERSDLFEVDSYFGQDPSGACEALALRMFTHCRVPLLRAHFRREGDSWKLAGIAAIGASQVPQHHRAFLLEAATRHVTGAQPARPSVPAGDAPKVAILHDPAEVDRPSNDEALAKFVEAARKVGLAAEIVGPEAQERLPEFDGLFIRTTTNVGQYTYEWARRAESLGMVVVDDPDSILRCTNKVYVGELMARHRVPVPRTMMVHRGNLDEVVPALGLPVVLKEPDGGFGLGVVKIGKEQDFIPRATERLARSELLVAQQWLPTEFDWRVGVYDRRPLFACKYFMAPGHWQIIKRDDSGRIEGQTLAMSIGEVPQVVIETAVRAANLIGAGLYGVDLKQSGGQCWLIEINDNPNIDAGNEDQILGDALYREIMGVFARRIGQRRTRA